MPKFLVQNLSDRPVRLAIEPWADLEVMAPNGRVEFEYNEPAEIAFALSNDGAIVDIFSDHIKVTANGGEKTFMPPESW
jgi:hypothetical protein